MQSRPHFVRTLVEYFLDDEAAQAAIQELKAVGFTDAQIDVCCTITAEQSPSVPRAYHTMGQQPDGAATLVFVPQECRLSEANPGIGIASQTFAPVNDMYPGPHRGGVKAGQVVVTVRAGTRADIAQCVLNRFVDATTQPQ